MVDTLVGAVAKFSDEDVQQQHTFAVVSGNDYNAFQIDKATGQISVLSQVLNYESQASYSLTVNVTDDGSPPLSDTAVISISLTDVNEAPTLAKGQSGTVQENSAANTPVFTVVVNDVDTKNVVWSKITWSISGAGNAFDIDANSGLISVKTNVIDFETQSLYKFKVTAQDGGGLSAVENVEVAVTDTNERPVLANQVRTVNENSLKGTAVGLALPGVDPDANQTATLKYSIVGGDSGNRFEMDGAQLKVAKSNSLDFESKSQYVLTIRVEDQPANGIPKLFHQATCTVNVVDLNEHPILNDRVFYAKEDMKPNVPVSIAAGSDVDIGQVLSYTIIAGNRDELNGVNDVFTINPCSAEISLGPNADLQYLLQVSYNLTIMAEDNGDPKLFDTAHVVIQVVDTNDPPVINDFHLSISENSAVNVRAGVVFASDIDERQRASWAIVSGNVGDAFMIASMTAYTAEIVVKTANLNFEAYSTYSLKVRVKDNSTMADRGAPLSDDATITVKLVDVNEVILSFIQASLKHLYALFVLFLSLQHPQFDNSTLVKAVYENVPSNTNVGLIVKVTDVDAGDDVTFSMNHEYFQTIKVAGALAAQITTKENAVLDFETQSLYVVPINVTDTAGLSASSFVTINLQDVNEHPVIAANEVREVEENSPIGTRVGLPINGSDVDDGQILSYKISSGGKVADIFKIDEATGQLELRQAELNYELQKQYVLQVTVTDNGSPPLSAACEVTINLQDVNERPNLDVTVHTVAENSLPNTVVSQLVRGHDVDDNDNVRFYVTGGTGAEFFNISASSGQIAVKKYGLNYELQSSYSLEVTVVDSANGLKGRKGVAKLNFTAAVTILVRLFRKKTFY
jgi:VCBS repeat-containing protein